MKALVSALAAGAIFGVGLCVSGMTDPKNIIAFLDFTGHWSPNLAGVMVGAIAVHASWLRLSTRAGARSGSASARGHSLAPRAGSAHIDGALVGGAALFGVGWGLSGYCPGPAIVALGSGARAPMVFVVAMVLGMLLTDALRGLTKNTTSACPGQPSAAE